MDARITRQRLGNLISYDWLKMLGTILAFVLVLVLLFTMTATRPRQDQEYGIYAYTDVQAGENFSDLGDALMEKKVFSYDVLTATAESFAGNSYADSVFQARRAAGQGTVMFMTDNPTYETDENGEYVLDETTTRNTIWRSARTILRSSSGRTGRRTMRLTERRRPSRASPAATTRTSAIARRSRR